MSDGFSLASAARALDGAISRLVSDISSPRGAPGGEWVPALAGYSTARQETIALIRDLTQEQADFSPAPRVWSMGQNVEHLLLTEKLYRTQIRNLIDLAKKGGRKNIDLTFEQIDTSLAFIPREVMPIFTVPLNMFNRFVPQVIRNTMFRVPLVPAIAPRVSDPARYIPVAALRERAAFSIAATEELLYGDLPPNLSEMTLSHPILGVNNVAQILGIIAAHEERHQAQMRRVRENPRFPAAKA